jgi:predicted dehydrogenase
MKRREFIRHSVAAATTLGLATYVPAQAQGANDKIVLALIGCGGRGTGTILNCAKKQPNVDIKAVCDVNRTKLGKTAKGFSGAVGHNVEAVEDMKKLFDDKDINAVWVATPEHWHMLASIWAVQAGKDVYVEKNPSINIFEGRQLIKAAAKYNRVVQIGFQNRSAPYAFSARDYIKSGKLGKIVTVKSYCTLGGGKFSEAPEVPVPAWLDWDKWLGPAPMRPYSPTIVNEGGRGNWGYYWEYGGGALSDDASHVIDVARLVVGDPAHPMSVYAWGGNKAFGGASEAPEFQEIVYDFGDFPWTCTSGNATNYMKKTPGNIRGDKTKFPHWQTNATRTEIYGTEGLMYFGRHGGGWQVIGKNDEVVAEGGGVFPDADHQTNFIKALRREEKANGDVEQCHLSAAMIHLGNIACRVGNKQLLFDGATEKFTNSDEANVIARGTYRKGYVVPEEV